MTLAGCMGKMEEYSGICLSVVTWLKTRYIYLLVRKHTFHVGVDDQAAIQIQLHKLFTKKWEQFPLISVL